MTCTCPKCQATIEISVPEVTEQGTTASCPACKASFHLYLESFGGRAFRKCGEIVCAKCGNELGPESHCRHCGLPFPSYVVIGLTRRRRASKATKLQLNFNFAPSRKQAPRGSTMDLPSLETAMKQEEAASKRKPVVGKAQSSRKVALAVGLLVSVALAAGGAAVYLKMRAEKTFVQNFALATYGVQLGVDRSRKSYQKIAADWKAKADAGQSFVPRPAVDDEKDLNSIKNKLNDLRPKLAEEPAKFKDSTPKLAKFEGVFDKMRSLALAPGNSLPAYTDSINKAEADYKVAANELKIGITPELLDHLKKAAQRYRGLRPLFK